MVDIMVDLETLNNKHDSVIIQIGACAFNRDTKEIFAEFKTNVSPQSCVNAGLTVGVDTVMWWLKQSKEAQESVTARGKDLKTALQDFVTWAQTIPTFSATRPMDINMWAHGSFDIPILQTAFEKVDLKPFWRYSSTRDLRTLVDIAKINVYARKREGTHHDALADCKFQVSYAVDALKKVGRR